MTDQPEIQPCPWCGHARCFVPDACAMPDEHGSKDHECYWVECGACSAQGPWMARADAITAWNEMAGAQKILKDVAVALSSLHSIMVFHVRDWSANSRDTWLWGVLVGWDEPSYEQFREQYRELDRDGIARLKQLRAAVAAVYDDDRDGNLHDTRPEGGADGS